ncbi:hypothetical protein [Microbacterium sp. 179-I 3D4 NHS]|uniref:hypothetical protein n=1 Tax=Microbacterium sp. 179-I 3D4 NHS TaxID=3142381 RepID=UPI0039A07EA6
MTSPAAGGIRRARSDRASGRAEHRVLLASGVDLSPLPARAAVGRDSGIGRVTAPSPARRAAGILGLILALAIGASVPLVADMMAVAG